MSTCTCIPILEYRDSNCAFSKPRKSWGQKQYKYPLSDIATLGRCYSPVCCPVDPDDKKANKGTCISWVAGLVARQGPKACLTTGCGGRRLLQGPPDSTHTDLRPSLLLTSYYSRVLFACSMLHNYYCIHLWIVCCLEYNKLSWIINK